MRSHFFILLFLASFLTYAQDLKRSKPTEKASYYHDQFQGKNTSSGEAFNQADFTAAHRTLPFGEIVCVSNTINHRTAIVRINDRGPFRKSRAIDVSRAAAQRLGMIPFGVVPVKITPLHLLDHYPVTDSSFQDNEWWTVKAEKTAAPEYHIELWSTSDWKHAFYVASDLALHELEVDFLVHVNRTGANNRYMICTPTTDEASAEKRLRHYRTEGFPRARIISPTR